MFLEKYTEAQLRQLPVESLMDLHEDTQNRIKSHSSAEYPIREYLKDQFDFKTKIMSEIMRRKDEYE